jgi:hypothetical protein
MHKSPSVLDISYEVDRGHHFKIAGIGSDLTLVVNIYAPLGYSNMNNVMDTIQNHNGDNIILGGYFNLTLTGSDSQRWQITEAERRKADIVNRRVNKN